MERSPNIRACALIPCLNGAASIAAVIEGVTAQLEDVLVVDDGSVDETGAIASAAGARVVRHAENRGKGAALLTGMAAAREAGFTHVVTLDADGQHDPADIAVLLAAAREQPTAIVVGARDFDVPNVPGGSRFGRRFSNFWVRLETGQSLGDTQSGFRVYPVELSLALGVGPSRFEFEVEILVRAAWARVPLAERPISVFYPPAHERVSHYRGFVDSMRITGLHFRLVGRWMLRPLWPTRRLIGRTG